MRKVFIRCVFPPYVDTTWDLKIDNPTKQNVLNRLKEISKLGGKYLNEDHAIYLAISDFPDWLVEKERFSISHQIGECSIFIIVEEI